MRITKNKIKSNKLFTVVLILLAFVFALVKLPKDRFDLKSTLVKATTVKPEPFTELYFEDHTKLPKTIQPDAPHDFTFTVSNQEGRSEEYSYSVYFEDGSDKVIIDEGSFVLNNNNSKSKDIEFTSIDAEKLKVTVELTNKKQQISFWMFKEK